MLNYDTLRGFIVKQPYANYIINGTKKWELRNRYPPQSTIGQKMYLLSSGYALGYIKILSAKLVYFEQLYNNYDLHRVPIEYFDEDVILYAWEVKVFEKFQKPKKYKHPNGAQIWVKNVIIENEYK